MYKLLYVLTSSDKDLYCEQCILSIMSAKRNSPSAKISLLIDDITKKNIEANSNRKQLFGIVDELVSVPRPNSFSAMETSRYLKTKMREFIKGDFLYIDSDTIVCDELKDIENTPSDLCAVLDQHTSRSHNTHAIIFQKHLETISKAKEYLTYENYFNGGVLWVRDVESNHKFFDDWHNNWLYSRSKGMKIDMPALALANYQNKFAIQEIDGSWNCQVWFGANHLAKAKIIHYFTSNTGFTEGYNQYSVTLPQKLKEGHKLTEADWDIIQNAKSAFPSPNAIITGSDYEIYKSSLCGLIRAIYRRKKLFSFLENILNVIRIFRAKTMLNRK